MEEFLGIYKVEYSSKIPHKQHNHDAGYDLFAPSDETIKPNERIRIKLGIALQLPKSTFGLIQGRSSLAIKYGIDTIGNVIDEGYTGEISVILINHGNEDFIIKKDDRIAQIIIIPYLSVPAVQINNVVQKDTRGNTGVGSTGK